MRLVEQVHELLRKQLREGDFAIDATAGNGHDTAFLAETVGPSGRVITIDIQKRAIDATRERLRSRDLADRVRCIQGDHADVLSRIAASHGESTAAIVFNLGYLPGSDKTLRTRSAGTLRALECCPSLLRRGGLVCVTAYTGHAGGADEAGAVRDWMQARHADGWRVESRSPVSGGKSAPPQLRVAWKP